MKTTHNAITARTISTLRNAMGPGYQLAGPAEAVLRATMGSAPTRLADPVQR